MFVKHWYGIKYTTELNLCRSTLFSQTYYTLLVSSGVDFEPHPNRYPSDSFGYLLKYREVSSIRKTISENLCLKHYKIFYNWKTFKSTIQQVKICVSNTARFSNCQTNVQQWKLNISTTVQHHQISSKTSTTFCKYPWKSKWTCNYINFVELKEVLPNYHSNLKKKAINCQKPSSPLKEYFVLS